MIFLSHLRLHTSRCKQWLVSRGKLKVIEFMNDRPNRLFDLFGFVAGGAKVIYDFQGRQNLAPFLGAK
jgi:hypothetical protein